MHSQNIWPGLALLCLLAACNLQKIDQLTACFSFAKTDPNCTTGCEIQFQTDCSFGADLRYSWNFGDNSTSVTSANPTHTFSGNGPYIVTLNVSDPGGNTAIFKDTISFTGGNTGGSLAADFQIAPVKGGKIYEGCPVAFVNTSTGDATSYNWSFGNGSTSTDAAPTTIYPAPGNYTVTLTAGKNGQTSTKTQAITVFEAKKFQNLFTGLGNGAVADIMQDTNGIYWVALYYGQTAELRRYNASGSEIGSTSIASNGIVYGAAMAPNQTVYVTGADNSTGLSFIKQINSGGTVVKTQTIDCTPSDIKVLSNGNVVVIGSVLEATPIEGETDLYIAQFSASLTPVGTPQIIGQQSIHDLGAEIVETADGLLYVVGSRGAGFHLPDLKIWQLSSAGSYLDEFTVGVSAMSERGYGIVPAAGNTLAFCGYKSGKFSVGKVNQSNLEQIFLKEGFGQGTAYALLEETNGDLLIGGYFADGKIAIKTDPNAISATIQIAKPTADEFHCLKVLKTLDCGYLLAGYRVSNNVEYPFMVKTNSKGEY